MKVAFFCVACSGLFAGKPAPTGSPQPSKAVLYLWERVYPRIGRDRLTISAACGW
ncbi:hypothetical protein RK21_04924 [Pseudomonas plecoglossicida]|nr:hypothetical protein RK21_04924 [Pseudomonas plecoglossicida]